jgi:hypothetical protein
MKGLSKEGAALIRHSGRRSRQARRVLRAMKAGITDPAALESIRYGARRLTSSGRVVLAPKVKAARREEAKRPSSSAEPFDAGRRPLLDLFRRSGPR